MFLDEAVACVRFAVPRKLEINTQHGSNLTRDNERDKYPSPTLFFV